MENIFTPPQYVVGNLCEIKHRYPIVALANFVKLAEDQGWARADIKRLIDAAASLTKSNLDNLLEAHLSSNI